MCNKYLHVQDIGISEVSLNEYSFTITIFICIIKVLLQR